MEKLMSLTMKTAALALVALTASCNLDDLGTGTVSGGPAPAPTGKGEGTPAPIAEPATVETVDTPPSAETLAAEGALRTRLEAVLQPVTGARVAFIDCATAACSARVVAPSRTALRDVLQAVSQDRNGR